MSSVSTYLRQNVLGLVAMFLALNAGAYAVTKDEGSKRVFNQDLANSAVDSRVLASGAVGGPEIQAASVGPKKIKLEKLVTRLQKRVDGVCPDGQLVQSITPDGDVTCAPAGAGTITGVTATDGLTGGGNQGDVEIGVDPAQIQSRITDDCSGNEAVQSIGEDGGVSCGTISATGAAGGDLTGSFPNPSLANGAIDSASLFSAGLQDGAPGTTTLRSLGTGSNQAAAGNDPRLSDARTPTGAAGGDLTGTYPNPTLAAGAVGADNFAALPGGKMVQTSCQTIPNAGFHGVDFDSTSFSRDVTFNDANDSMTLGTGGTYLVTAYVEWAQNGNGDRALSFETTSGNNANGFDTRTATGSTTQGQTVAQLVSLPAGATLTALAGQGSGGDLSFVNFGAGCASLAAVWLGP